MSGDFRKKSSGIFITVFIGLIIVSFVITGYDGGRGGTSVIGSVGDYKIDYSEFQNVYERQLGFYRQFYGGRDLTSKEIKQFQIKENIVKQLVQEKLVMVFADEIGVFPSQAEVKDTIANFTQDDKKIFQTAGKFNVELYKRMLSGARISPAQFEKQNETQLKKKTIIELISKIPLSKGFIKEVETLKEKKIKVDIVQITKKGMEPYLPISDSEIKDYLAKNLPQVKAKFDIEKARLAKPEEIKARHILISDSEKDAKQTAYSLAKKITPKNFKEYAKKYNKNPSEKESGGDLGWFPRNSLLKEFEDVAFALKPGVVSPVLKTKFGYHIILVEDKRAEYVPDFEKLKKSMAKEILQSEKPFEVEKLVQDLSKEIGELLKSGKLSKVEEISKKYNLDFKKEVVINQLDGAKGQANISPDSLNKIFSENLVSHKTYVFANPIGVSLIRAIGDKSKAEKQDQDSVRQIAMELGQIMMADITNSVKNDVKVSLYKFFE